MIKVKSCNSLPENVIFTYLDINSHDFCAVFKNMFKILIKQK